MARSRPEPAPAKTGYVAWSRDPAVGVFAVLPLWLLYEVLRLTLAPSERNGAEALMSEAVRLLGPTAFSVLRGVLAIVVVVSAVAIERRGIPWLRVTGGIMLEGVLYGILLGPLAGALEVSATRVLAIAPGSESLVRDLVGSLGAGLFEELLFRLILLSVLALALIRVAGAFGAPRSIGVVAAVLLSAVVFSLFHHIGPGAAPLQQQVFVFRAMAGVVLGMLFVARGFGVCVYTHALYDVYFYVTH